jgi:hypothetical protein
VGKFLSETPKITPTTKANHPKDQHPELAQCLGHDRERPYAIQATKPDITAYTKTEVRTKHASLKEIQQHAKEPLRAKQN